MRKKVSSTIIIFSFLCLSTFGQNPRTGIKGDYLLQTEWAGSGLFTKFSPDNHTLGCHSIAIGQVLNYHKLAPIGTVEYDCSTGNVIREDFSEYELNWKLLADSLTETSPQEQVEATAYYNYAVACVVQKDFE